jgi:hypothetical protein
MRNKASFWSWHRLCEGRLVAVARHSFRGKKAMNLHDKAQELVEREEQELDERFRQLRDEYVEPLDEELAHIVLRANSF